MATQPSTTHHHLQDPQTALYYRALPDGTHGLTPKPQQALAFQTSALAIEYATGPLAGQPCELARVTQ